MTTTATTTRFALIDSNSGYVWGVTSASTPADACQVIDADFGEHGRRYEEISASESGRDHYRVFDATTLDARFDDAGGQDQGFIDAVDALPLVARIAWVDRD